MYFMEDKLKMQTLQKTKKTSLLDRDIFTQIMLNQLELKTDSKPVRNGFGYCWKCGCRAYEGSGYICDNCGHHYDHHS